MGRLDDRVVLITGAARGQGEAHARRFAAEGAKVIITDVLHDEGKTLAADLGADAMYLSLDVSSETAWNDAVKTAVGHYGRIDGLLNNAGVIQFAPLLQTSLDQYRRLIDINQVGVFLGMRSVAPHMPRGGSIVNVSSIDGLMGMPGVVAYVASKFAVRGMTKTAAIEFAPLGIRVNSIHPGLILTPMLDDPVIKAGIDTVLQSTPMGRAASPDEVAALALYLLSEESSYSTGAEFVVDGGLSCGKSVPVEAPA
jgi:3alpha(or 20beta)-hydroxysteroid dehydrogenase